MKKSLSLFLAAAMSAALLTGCSSPKTGPSAVPETAAKSTESLSTADSGTEAAKSDPAASGTEAAKTDTETAKSDSASTKDAVRVAGLKGPTTMGLVKLMEDAENGQTENTYDFTMVTAVDELTALVGGGKVDIALLPANVAGVLYNKTGGKISVIDINTLGVLYLVSADSSIESVEQLKGKTVYLPGKGTTPEFALRYLLSAAGLSDSDVTLEFKSEPAEVAAILAEDPSAIGLLPQPFVSVALAQNDQLGIVMDLSKLWDELQTEGSQSRLVTGVTIVNNDFLANHKDAVDTFLKEHQASIEFVEEDPDQAAELIAKAGIVAKAPIAKAALPYCHVAFLEGAPMKEALSGYLSVLYDQNPASVGGALPDDAFYYIP